MHNALQGADINLTRLKMGIYEEVVFENAVRNHLHHDIVVVHDPQPLPMIMHYRKRGPWIWRCHVDLSEPNREILKYLTPFLQTCPLIVQISRFDRWKDPEGVIEAFRIARREVKATLVLLGNVAMDDPEGTEIFESLLEKREERIIILSVQDSALVNDIQRRAAVVLQKSIREGFGLTVAEAMWKGTPVIGGNVGGIRYQIRNGVNGFLVNSIEEAAVRIVQLIKNPKIRERMGKKAKETVRKKFLMTRLVEQYLDLFNSFETNYKLKKT